MLIKMNELSKIYLDYREAVFLVVKPQKIIGNYLIGLKFQRESEKISITCLSLKRILKVCRETNYLKKYRDKNKEGASALVKILVCESFIKIIQKITQEVWFAELYLEWGKEVAGIIKGLNADKTITSLKKFDEWQADFDGITYISIDKNLEISLPLDKPFVI